MTRLLTVNFSRAHASKWRDGVVCILIIYLAEMSRHLRFRPYTPDHIAFPLLEFSSWLALVPAARLQTREGRPNINV